MKNRNELNSHPSAVKCATPGEGNSAGALARVEHLPTFDRSLSTLTRQLEAMTDAGWVTTRAEQAGECK